MNWAIVEKGTNTVDPNVDDVDLVFRRWGVDQRLVEVVSVGEESVVIESDVGVIASALPVDESTVKSLVEKEYVSVS